MLQSYNSKSSTKQQHNKQIKLLKFTIQLWNQTRDISLFSTLMNDILSKPSAYWWDSKENFVIAHLYHFIIFNCKAHDGIPGITLAQIINICICLWQNSNLYFQREHNWLDSNPLYASTICSVPCSTVLTIPYQLIQFAQFPSLLSSM